MSFTYGPTYSTPPYSSPCSAPSYPVPAYPAASTSATPEFLVSDIHRSELALQIAQQGSIYTPEASRKFAQQHPNHKGHARETVLRKAGGTVWEDPSLAEWDPSHFRLFCGNLDPAMPDEQFANAFNKWPSFVKSHLVRDKLSNKVKYGFVAYSNPDDFLAAWRTLNGKYVGTRPIKLSKATTRVATVGIGERKARALDRLHHKQKTGTVAFSKAKIAQAEGGGLNSTGVDRSRKSYIRR